MEVDIIILILQIRKMRPGERSYPKERMALSGCDGSNMTLESILLRGSQNMVRNNDIK